MGRAIVWFLEIIPLKSDVSFGGGGGGLKKLYLFIHENG